MATSTMAMLKWSYIVRRLHENTVNQGRLYAYVVAHVLGIGVQGIVDEYYQLCRYFDPCITTMALDATRTDGMERNYGTPCQDNHRVINTWPGIPYDFYHANYIPTPLNKHRLIAAQSPSEKLMRDFLNLIISQNIEYVIKPCVYPSTDEHLEIWPQSGERRYGNLTLRNTSSMHNEKDHVYVNNYTIEMFDENNDKLNTDFTHYVWGNWPRHKVPKIPDGQNQQDLTFHFIYDLVKHSKAPILIHSTDGVGRAGTIATIFHAVDSIENRYLDFSMFKSAEIVMQHRALAIGRAQQYVYAYQVIVNKAVDLYYTQLWSDIDNVTGMLFNFYRESRCKLPQPRNKDKPGIPTSILRPPGRKLPRCFKRAAVGFVLLGLLLLTLVILFVIVPVGNSADHTPAPDLAPDKISGHQSSTIGSIAKPTTIKYKGL